MQSTLPDILRKLRLDRKYSQENIAEELKVNATTYGAYENGKRPIKFEQVAQLAEFYGLTLDELYHYGDKTFQVAEPFPAYQRKRSVTLSIELDGEKSTVDFWIDKIKKLNAAIA